MTHSISPRFSNSYYTPHTQNPHKRKRSISSMAPHPFSSKRRKTLKSTEYSDIDKVMKIYKRQVYFAPANRTSARSIRKHGMDVSRKTRGCTAMIKESYDLDDPNARRYNYVMTLPEAAEYAKMHRDPDIVVMFIPKDIDLEADPEGDSRTAFRTDQLIDSYLILPKNPENLHTKQLKKINRRLGIFLVKPVQLKELKNRVRKEWMGDKTKVIESSKSYFEQEAERDCITQDIMKKLGIDLSTLKPGDTISIPL